MSIKYSIIGQRSKIAQHITTLMPKEFILIDETEIEANPDVELLMLSTDSKKAQDYINRYPNVKIIDLSTSQRLNSFTNSKNQKLVNYNFIYGLTVVNDKIEDKNVSSPGCSPTGSITALFPIKDYLESDVYINVMFSKSAMRANSSNKDRIEDNIILTQPFEHFHQKEIQYVLENLNIHFIANIVDIDRGISLNISAKIKNKNDAYSILKEFYKNDERIEVSNVEIKTVKEVINTNKIFIFIKQDEQNVIINVCFDNLISGGAYPAVESATQMFKR